MNKLRHYLGLPFATVGVFSLLAGAYIYGGRRHVNLVLNALLTGQVVMGMTDAGR